ncbi:hypothetical protein CBP33_02640 [Acidovorax carolinensis]|nr:hypothetical protein CBP33_02640 [Acidovorax carolinensis]
MPQYSSNRHTLFLLTVLALYLIAYFSHPALPGNNPAYPLGWWGWFDQGEYLKAAKAIGSHDFSSKNYFYPPLYPLLGAAFATVNPMHAFTVLNAACFIIFAHCFVTTAKRYVGWKWAATIFILTYGFSKHSVQIWTEPWTSSLVSAIFAFLLGQVDQRTGENFKVSRTQLALWGALGGATFLTRPADAVVISPLFCYVLWRLWRSRWYQEAPPPVTLIIQKTAALLAPGLLGVALFAGFNLFVHGSIGGRYFSMAETNGFHAVDLLEKTVSLLFDGGTLYNAPTESILFRAKWLALFVPAAIFGFMRGNASTRLILALIATQWLIYSSFADLLPTGVWSYHNIHYFKWIFPYAGLLIAVWIKATPLGVAQRAGARYWWISLTIGTLLLATQLKLDETAKNEVEATLLQDAHGQFLRIRSSTPHTIDKMSVPQLSGDFQAIYFSTNAKVDAGGKELKFVRDYRFLPSEKGVDLVFIRPVRTDVINIHAGDMKLAPTSATPHWFTYRFTMGMPAWLR